MSWNDEPAPSLAVELSCPSAHPPVRAPASLVSLADRHCRLVSAVDLPPLAPETGLTLTVTARPALEIVGVVEHHSGRTIGLRVTRVGHREKRYFPREDGGLAVRWRPVDPDHADDAPRGSPTTMPSSAEFDDGWHRPQPFVNFSASGIRFHDRAPVAKGDALRVAFQVDPAEPWHLTTAEVVRCSALPKDTADTAPSGRDASEIAVAFRTISAPALEALADYTLDQQVAALARHALGRL